MIRIIIYVTLGVVFAFCAAAVLMMLPFDKLFGGKRKKNK